MSLFSNYVKKVQVLCCNMLYPVYPCYITVLWEGLLCCLSSHCMLKLVFSCVLTCSFTMWASVACAYPTGHANDAHVGICKVLFISLTNPGKHFVSVCFSFN